MDTAERERTPGGLKPDGAPSNFRCKYELTLSCRKTVLLQICHVLIHRIRIQLLVPLGVMLVCIQMGFEASDNYSNHFV